MRYNNIQPARFISCPNRVTHEAFADALVEAEKIGVNIRALNCTVTPDELKIAKRG